MEEEEGDQVEHQQAKVPFKVQKALRRFLVSGWQGGCVSCRLGCLGESEKGGECEKIKFLFATIINWATAYFLFLF